MVPMTLGHRRLQLCRVLRIRSHRYQQDSQGRYHLPPLRGAAGVVAQVVAQVVVQVGLQRVGK